MSEDLAYAGIDLGGTKILAVIVDGEGRLLASEEQPTLAEEGSERVMARMTDMMRRLIAASGKRISTLGVATAGTLDPTAGSVLEAVNLGWTNVPLGQTLARELNVKVTVENDANAAAYGEWKAGAGRGTRHCVFVTVSTGVGGGVISDGRLVRGLTASAGEIGHITIDWNGPVCGCGNVGCLELYASGTAIGRAAAAAAAADPTAGRAMLALAGGEASRITSREVAAAAAGGDALALKLLREAGRALGIGLASVIHLANPELLIIGGGASKIGAPLLGPMEEALRRHTIPSVGAPVRIVKPSLGVPAGAIGAALIAADLQEQA